MEFLLAIYIVFLIIKRNKYRISFWIGMPLFIFLNSICSLEISKISKIASNSSESVGVAISIGIIIYLSVVLYAVIYFLFIDFFINTIIDLKSIKSRDMYFFLNIGWIFFLVLCIFILTGFLSMAIPEMIRSVL